MMGTEKNELLYNVIPESENVSQGDILFNFPIFLPTKESIEGLDKITSESMTGKLEFSMFDTDLIILSQSCDLVFNPEISRYPVDPVICATIHDIGQFSSFNLVSETNSGRRPSYYLLNKDGSHLDKSYIIDFGSIHTIPYSVISKFAKNAGNRIRPISPILEKISQHFGNYFSRIGTEYERPKADLKAEYESLREQHDPQRKTS